MIKLNLIYKFRKPPVWNSKEHPTDLSSGVQSRLLLEIIEFENDFSLKPLDFTVLSTYSGQIWIKIGDISFSFWGVLLKPCVYCLPLGFVKYDNIAYFLMQRKIDKNHKNKTNITTNASIKTKCLRLTSLSDLPITLKINEKIKVNIKATSRRIKVGDDF
jgi:hypothetical protein